MTFTEIKYIAKGIVRLVVIYYMIENTKLKLIKLIIQQLLVVIMSSIDEKYDFSKEDVCAEYFKEKVHPELSKLKLHNIDYSGSYYANISFGKTKEYKQEIPNDGRKTRSFEPEYYKGTTYTGLQVSIEAEWNKYNSEPVIFGKLCLNAQKQAGENDPLFTWESIDEMVEKIKGLM